MTDDKRRYKTILFPHIPKTGGTTMLYHFRKNFGDENIISYGPDGRHMRFFEDKRQLEEIAPDQVAKFKLVQGHGVNESVLGYLRSSDVRLITILRNPIKLTRSRFNHRVQHMQNLGVAVDQAEFVNAIGSNQACSFFCEKFPTFIDDKSAPLLDQTISVLKKFHYVFTTEQLDAQAVGFMQDFNLPTTLERRRVSETYAPLDMSDADILKSNQSDLALFEIANKLVAQPGQHNAFGHDEEGSAKAISAVLVPTPEAVQADCYAALAASLATNLLAEAALAKLAAGKVTAIRDAPTFTLVLQEKWHKAQRQMTAARKEISAANLAKWQANNIAE